MLKIRTLEDLLTDELQDLYSAETQLVKALPRLAKAVDADDLRSVLEEHLQQTQEHVERLERICGKLEINPRGRKCTGMEGLIDESRELLAAEGENSSRDAGVIGAAQRVEHYEIAAYGTARAHARQLGFVELANLLGKTLEEEKRADAKLTHIAENLVNVRAAMQKPGEEVKL